MADTHPMMLWNFGKGQERAKVVWGGKAAHR
jgi:hypothetical protein